MTSLLLRLIAPLLPYLWAAIGAPDWRRVIAMSVETIIAAAAVAYLTGQYLAPIAVAVLSVLINTVVQSFSGVVAELWNRQS